MSENDWQAPESAPKDGTYILVDGYYDTSTPNRLIKIPASWNPFYKHWVTRKGQIIFPVKWKEII